MTLNNHNFSKLKKGPFWDSLCFLSFKVFPLKSSFFNKKLEFSLVFSQVLAVLNKQLTIFCSNYLVTLLCIAANNSCACALLRLSFVYTGSFSAHFKPANKNDVTTAKYVQKELRTWAQKGVIDAQKSVSRVVQKLLY